MAYTDLIIDQGTDFTSVLNLNADDGTPINVTNFVFSSQIKKSYYSSNVTATMSIVVLDAQNGATVLTLSAANTANIPAGRYVYDVKMVDIFGVTSRVVEGLVTVTPQVTS